VAAQGARDLLRGGRGGRAHGAARVGAHRRAVGTARPRLRDQAPHEASGDPRLSFSVSLGRSLFQSVSYPSVVVPSCRALCFLVRGFGSPFALLSFVDRTKA
jgi:hypothetical protein